MKILLICSLPLSLGNIKGGVESATINLLDGFGLLKDHINIKLISFNKNVNRLIRYNEKVEIEYIAYKLPMAFLDYFANFSTLKNRIINFHPDIIHIQAASPQLLRLLFLRKNNIVVTQHGIMSEEYKIKKSISDKAKFLFKVLIEKYIFPRFKNFIFISKYNKNLFPGSLSIKNTRIIPNALSSQYLKKPASFLDRKKLIYVGGISRRKNLILLLESMDILAKDGINLYLTVVGGFLENKYKEEIKNLLNNSPIKNNIRFVGWQEKEKVKELLKEHSVFILPSNQEILPISIAEAMVFEKIVIATNICGIPEMIKHEETGFLFEKNNKLRLSDTLRNIHNNNYDLVKISNKASESALINYHPQLIAKRTLKFYCKIIKINP